MPSYQVPVNGVNFLLLVEDVPKRMSFHTVRFVEARDADEAAALAARLVREELGEAIRNDADDPPGVRVGEVVELDPDASFPVQPGLAFYEDQ